MASLQLELDRIINDTIHRTLGGSHVYEESILREVQNRANGPLVPFDNDRNHSIITSSGGSLGISAANDQVDNLAQLLQNVELDQYERIFWILFFSIMVLVAAGGNIIVIYIVSTNKEMKSVTNYFLVNLSLADTMVSTLNVIFNFISMLNSHWPFGKVYCKISNFIAILSISASVFTLTAISCDRYNAIIYPLRPRMSHRHAIAWILLIWTLSSALALPNAIYSTLVEDRLISDTVATTCTMIWPDGRYPQSSYDHIYNIVVLVLTYLVPIITMAILYYKVGKELWGYEAIGENVDKQRRAIMAKKKIVKMMIVVVIIFALCWLPYHAFFVVNYYLPIFQEAPLHYQRCYLLMYWMAMSNSMYNPIIIYFMNSKFREEFKRVLYFICCCRSYNPPQITSRPSDNMHSNQNNAESCTNHSSIRGEHQSQKAQNHLIRGPHQLSTDQKSSLANSGQLDPAQNRLYPTPSDPAGDENSNHKLNHSEAAGECDPFILDNSVQDNFSDLNNAGGAGEKLIDLATRRSAATHHYGDHHYDKLKVDANSKTSSRLDSNEEADNSVWI